MTDDVETTASAEQAPDEAEGEATTETTPEEVGGSAPPTSPPSLEEMLAEAERQRDEYLDHLQRLKAEFDNYRKRSLRDQEALVARAHERLVNELLPILDDLERALDAAEVHDEASVVEGVKLVQRALLSSLEREGLAEIEAEGAFDPHVHEALLAQPGEGAEPGSVLQVVQKGYRLGDKVLRPARVVVAAEE
ncbi:MAG TPA: nucleotide exchange factor GrpE [Acidimicrobiia bacterium]|nr:nucleotide exchange factor GrpE [Acidimicrobiia bacterium]